MKAIIYKSTGSWYLAKDELGRSYKARAVGKLKLEQSGATNPIAVGDWVTLENQEDENNTVITEVYKRKNYIVRASPHSKHHHHIVASNLDQSILLVTLREPKTSLGFIDRFLITSEAYHIPAVLLINKTDLLKPRDMEQLEVIKLIYGGAGYPVFPISLLNKSGLDQVKGLLNGKVSLLSGHSGVGKSTFINELFAEVKIKTQDVSSWSGKGMHTTTFAEMYDLPDGGQLIDTPGIRELGLVDMEKTELSHYFPEMRALIGQCQFNNCLHLNEPGCAIKKAVASEDNSVTEVRYLSYLNLLDSIGNSSY